MVYNPLDYAWPGHAAYIQTYAPSRANAVFLGMNPGPFGMVQTGVPFGEVASVRDWMKLEFDVERPDNVHPARPIEGLACPRSEVSGARLWGLFRARFKTPEKFFARHFVINFCPLAFLEASGRNRTPDKLPREERLPLEAACEQHLRRLLECLQPRWVVGVGAFAVDRARRVATDGMEVVSMLHPSPASPAANRDWAGTAQQQLEAAGVWKKTAGD
jgi:single-strand selective monofunctional uracil DNA glycosylase